MSSRVLVVFGYGSRVSTCIVDFFLSKGYQVATVSRSAHPELSGKTEHITADLGDVNSIDFVFDQVTSKLGAVNTVVYNAFTLAYNNQKNPFEAPVSYLQHSQNVGVNSAYRAAQLLLESKAPASQKHFIYSGNMLHRTPQPVALGLGLEKAAAVHMIGIGAKAYGNNGGPFFYYAWEQNADGTSPADNVNGDAYAQIYWDLVQLDKQSHYDVLFVKGENGESATIKPDLKLAYPA
jgi:NAD(P)-dependent dehydrogenase (short-subunit alcohol dehydrogenase family)